MTRKLLAEAKQAAAHIRSEEREDFINAINEVLTYCRMQTDAKKPAAAATAAPTPAETAKKAEPVKKSAVPAAAAPVVAASGGGDSKKSAQEEKKSGQEDALSKTSGNAKFFTAPAPKADDSSKAKMSNPDVMVRKASVLVTQKKPAAIFTAPVPKVKRNRAEKAFADLCCCFFSQNDPGPGEKKSSATVTAKKGGALSEKERLISALSAKKVLSKVGKLQKEGGGKSLLGRKNWKERLFELSESSLEYYEKSNTTEKVGFCFASQYFFPKKRRLEQPLGTISLHEVSTARSCTVANKSFCFEVVTAERTLQIQAAR